MRGGPTSRLVFIPKLGRALYMVPKAYRPVSLTFLLLETLEKLVGRYVDDRVLKIHPVHPNQQHAYRSGLIKQPFMHWLAG